MNRKSVPPAMFYICDFLGAGNFEDILLSGPKDHDSQRCGKMLRTFLLPQFLLLSPNLVNLLSELHRQEGEKGKDLHSL